MDFLGFYNIFMALAFAGACGGAYNCDEAPDYGPDSAYMADDGGASNLPPAYAIINRPPTQIDNGYNPAFYWNQPHDEDSDEADADYSYGARYSNYPYYPAYPSYTRTYPAYVYNTAAGLGYAQATGGDYDNDGTDYDASYYDRPYRARHERHSTMEQNDRDHVRATMDRDMPAYERHDADRGTHPVSAGYNGHDRHMFDGDHRAAKPADNQLHAPNRGDVRQRPQE